MKFLIPFILLSFCFSSVGEKGKVLKKEIFNKIDQEMSKSNININITLNQLLKRAEDGNDPSQKFRGVNKRDEEVLKALEKVTPKDLEIVAQLLQTEEMKKCSGRFD